MLKLDDLFITYGDERYAELGVFLDLLRSLQFLHQQNHWQSSGPVFYSDHLLFERLYGTVTGQVDKVAEKAVALGNSGLVNSKHSLTNMPRFLIALEDTSSGFGEPPQTQMVKRSLLAEKSFVTAGEKLMKMLESKGLLTRGVEQLLGTILDEHEGLCYLLKQRVG
ncbi:MAG: hypothetical protein WC761_01210 [Candidatus Paceibacterota bacterium]|jgi:DNA-binding ferritin-like protein